LKSTTKKVSLKKCIVFSNNCKDDIWVIIHGKVYDLTNFLPEHPGGQKIILKYAGKDATNSFDPIHPPDIIQRLLPPDVFKGVVDPSALTQVLKVETEEDKRIRIARENMPNLDEMYNSFDFEGMYMFYSLELCYLIRAYAAVAKSVLKAEAWSYFSSGSENEITLRENHSAFHRIWFKPRVMVNVKYVDPSTTFLGTRTAFPLYISATALGKMGHPEGEVVLARASAKRNLIQMISNYTSCSFDEIVNASTPNHTQWIQIYINSNRKVTENLIRHAEARGMKGLFITVDVPQLGKFTKNNGAEQKY
jgi:L-lactate dehydrogenase (cytochrome)